MLSIMSSSDMEEDDLVLGSKLGSDKEATRKWKLSLDKVFLLASLEQFPGDAQACAYPEDRLLALCSLQIPH